MTAKIPGFGHLHASYRADAPAGFGMLRASGELALRLWRWEIVLTRKRVLRALSQRAPRLAMVVVAKPAWRTYRVRSPHLA
jgi:hypothetical protein